jgi:hypothetical protein
MEKGDAERILLQLEGLRDGYQEKIDELTEEINCLKQVVERSN